MDQTGSGCVMVVAVCEGYVTVNAGWYLAVAPSDTILIKHCTCTACFLVDLHLTIAMPNLCKVGQRAMASTLECQLY